MKHFLYNSITITIIVANTKNYRSNFVSIQQGSNNRGEKIRNFHENKIFLLMDIPFENWPNEKLITTPINPPGNRNPLVLDTSWTASLS